MKKLLIIPLLFIHSICSAAPEISLCGEIINNASTVVTGASFGSKSTASPVAWDNLEDGSGDINASIGTWKNPTSNLNIITSNNRHTGSIYCSATDLNTTSSSGIMSGVAIDKSKVSEKWFTQYWFKLGNDWNWGNTGIGGGNQSLANYKIARFWNEDYVGGDNEDTTLQAWGWYAQPYPAGVGYAFFVLAAEGSEKPFTQIEPGYETKWTKDVWHCIQVEYKEGTLNTFDGVFRLWVDGKLSYEDTTLKNKTHVDVYKAPICIGAYNAWPMDAGSQPPDTFYLDDMYADNTWSRVEIGNDPVYDSCTHREIQIPTAWSDTEITITINQGSFNNGEQAYLFVIDSDGNASEGYPITFGGTSLNTTGTLNYSGSLTLE